MPSDPELHLRGRLIRSLGALREMLPGSFVERQRKCGKPNCRCADGQHLHAVFQLSVLREGKLKTFHIPAAWAEEVRNKAEMHRRFQKAATAICQINLRRLLRRKQDQGRDSRQL